jgi:hypothetical protein
MLVDKGITKEVTKLFLNGTHTAQAVFEAMGSPTDNNRKGYIFKIVRDLRTKHGMDVNRRNANYGRKRKVKTKTGATSAPAQKSYQLALGLDNEDEPDASHEFDTSLAKHMGTWTQPKSLVIATKMLHKTEIDKLTEEYVTLHDQYKELKKQFDAVQKEAYKFQVETFDLKAIVKYLEAKNGN